MPAVGLCLYGKSVPYLKRGDFITWKKVIDQAVQVNPKGNLGYRGWCRYQFLRDYKGAIEDFEKLDSLLPYDIGYSQNGDYQLNIAKALCYKALGQKQKAIEIIELQLTKKDYLPMMYDYLHLGVVLKMETDHIEEAISCFNKSISNNDYMAEVYYYLALIYKNKNDTTAFADNMLKAKAYYEKGYRRLDPYTHPMDKIYLSDIERELATIKK